MDVEGGIQEGKPGCPEGLAGEVDWAAVQISPAVREKQEWAWINNAILLD